MFNFTAIIWIAVLSSPLAEASELIKRTLTSPEKICGQIGCFNVGPGEIALYKNVHLNNPLAYGPLATDTDLEGIKIKAGTRIEFYDPSKPDYDRMDFSIRLREDTIVAGVSFPAGSDVAFDRFYSVFNRELGKYVWVPLEFGIVRVGGLPIRDVAIQGVRLRAGKTLRFQTHIFRLADRDTTDNRLVAGSVAEQAFLPAQRPIQLMPGDWVSVDHGFTRVDISVSRGRVFQPEGYFASRAIYFFNSGNLNFIDLERETEIHSIRVRGDVRFHPNGFMEYFEPMAGPQTLGGVAVDEEISYYGEARMWPTGNLMTVATTLVKKNSDLLPAEVLAFFSEFPNAEVDRIRFFMNPAGQIRALEVEADEPHFFRMYVVEAGNGSPTFRDVTKDKTIGRLINESMRGDIKPEFEEYLRTH